MKYKSQGFSHEGLSSELRKKKLKIKLLKEKAYRKARNYHKNNAKFTSSDDENQHAVECPGIVKQIAKQNEGKNPELIN